MSSEKPLQGSPVPVGLYYPGQDGCHNALVALANGIHASLGGVAVGKGRKRRYPAFVRGCMTPHNNFGMTAIPSWLLNNNNPEFATKSLVEKGEVVEGALAVDGLAEVLRREHTLPIEGLELLDDQSTRRLPLFFALTIASGPGLKQLMKDLGMIHSALGNAGLRLEDFDTERDGAIPHISLVARQSRHKGDRRSNNNGLAAINQQRTPVVDGARQLWANSGVKSIVLCPLNVGPSYGKHYLQ